MIRIDRIRMHLPAGFEHRATAIARLVGDELAKRSISQDATLDSISIAPQSLSVEMPDGEIAHGIAQQIVSSIRGRA